MSSKRDGEPVAWSEGYPDTVDPQEFRARFRLTESGLPYLVRADGPCPRCKDPIWSIDTVLELDLFSGGSLSPEVIQDIAEETQRQFIAGLVEQKSVYRCRVICNCRQEHIGRPLNATPGCGAKFILHVPAQERQ
jgi:hypothetical protein